MSTASDFAKSNHAEIAALASLGFISTLTPAGFTRSWRLRPGGVDYIWDSLR